MNEITKLRDEHTRLSQRLALQQLEDAIAREAYRLRRENESMRRQLGEATP